MTAISMPPGGAIDSRSVYARVVASAALSGHRVVIPEVDGTARYASAANLFDMPGPLHLMVGALAGGASGDALVLGALSEPTWAWAGGQPIYLGLNGQLTQVPAASAAFVVVVAVAVAPTVLFYNPGAPIALT